MYSDRSVSRQQACALAIRSGLSIGVIAGIAIGGVAAIALMVIAVMLVKNSIGASKEGLKGVGTTSDIR